MLKLHKMLAEKVDHAFGAQLKPTENQRAFFVDCKNKIRDHLRKGIEAATVSKLGMERRVTPRFRTQGSWSYNTCVRPAQTPPQEMDWDFGVYLPVTVWEENGPPHVMAKLYFELVERLLQSLCNDEDGNWYPVRTRVFASNFRHGPTLTFLFTQPQRNNLLSSWKNRWPWSLEE